MGSARRRALVGCCLIAACLAIGTLVTSFGAPPFDRWVTLHVDTWRDGPGGAVLRAASHYGFGTFLIPVGVLLGVAVSWRRRVLAPALTLVLANPVTSLVNHGLKLLFDRARPTYDQYEATGGLSMPSGHAATAAAFAVACALAVPEGRPRHVVAWLGVALALIVGLSRVVLGVHWTTDVVAGWLQGAGVALVLSALLSRFGRRERTAPIG